jgi:hypothetical protein
MKKYPKPERRAYSRISPPTHTVPQIGTCPDGTTQKAAPSLLEGSDFFAQEKSATSSLHLECSSSIFINRDARNLKSQNSPPNVLGVHTPALSSAPDFLTGTSTRPQKTFEKTFRE